MTAKALMKPLNGRTQNFVCDTVGVTLLFLFMCQRMEMRFLVEENQTEITGV